MKNVFYLILVLLCWGCNSNKSGNDTSDSTQHDTSELISRDTSITAANAYNNFFLDTATVADYLKKQSITGEEAVRIHNFYNGRNFQFAWFTTNGLTEELRNFWNIYKYSDTTTQKDKADKKLFVMLDTLLPSTDEVVVSKSDTNYMNAEFGITRKFLTYISNRKDKNIDRLLPVKKYSITAYANMVLDEKRDMQGTTSIEKQYDALKKHLKQLAAQPVNKADTIAFAGKMKKGTESPVLPAFKRKLAAAGFMTATDTSTVFTDTLEQSVKAYQQSIGLKPDGVIAAPLVSALNASQNEQMAKVLVNMNRLLWIPDNLPDHYILVNIPEFMLHAYEGNKKVFDMPVVVGKEGTSTMMFSGDMNNVVFSPYWNLPESIVKKEVLPGLEKNSNYLESHHMEITGKRGDLPIVRQLPGPDNSLGKAKFLFPNSYDIYLHDTNAKYLFKRDVRAFSHGCIRLADAEKMANYILRNNKDWDSVKIHEAMNSNEEKWVKLKDTEPVLIAYLTAWVDDSNGRLGARQDIYGHDAIAMQRLFTDK